MPYRQIVFTCGYVENQQVGHIVFQKRYGEPHETVVETLTDFATALFYIWWDEEGVARVDKKCRCCGSELPEHKVTYHKAIRSFSDWIANFSSLTADQLDAESSDWYPWLLWNQMASVPVEETIEIYEKAEVILPMFVDFTDFEYCEELKNRYHEIAKQFCVDPVDALRFSIAPKTPTKAEALELEKKDHDK